ncbi:MAG: Gfo/Idh/MocA family oxidoreductase [Clostridia bacterium]|nr:Gfo/Idh/MocA family oxidoreductase [Clostridia bacterium]
MYKIGIIGSENSHAAAFIEIFKNEPKYAELEVVCVGGMYDEANQTLNEKYGVEIINSAEEMIGKVDAAMITCRDGKYHAGYAEPFIRAGIPLFVDKPFTTDAQEAFNLVQLARRENVPMVGGSAVKSCYDILMLKNAVEKDKKSVKGGMMIAPLNMKNEYSGFYFYSSHLAEMCLNVFGYDPIAVTAKENNDNVAVLVEYEDYTVNLLFASSCGKYFGQVVNADGIYSRDVDISIIYKHECEEFYNMLKNGSMKYTYEQLIKPVYFLNAIYKSYTTGKRVVVK